MPVATNVESIAIRLIQSVLQVEHKPDWEMSDNTKDFIFSWDGVLEPSGKEVADYFITLLKDTPNKSQKILGFDLVSQRFDYGNLGNSVLTLEYA